MSPTHFHVGIHLRAAVHQLLDDVHVSALARDEERTSAVLQTNTTALS